MPFYSRHSDDGSDRLLGGTHDEEVDYNDFMSMLFMNSSFADDMERHYKSSDADVLPSPTDSEETRENKEKQRNEEIMSNLYYDLEIGYGSKQSLYNQAKEKGASVTLEEVAKWLKKRPNKQVKPYQNYNSFLVPYARAEFQIDIMDMKIFKKEDEERYALIVIDAFSKLGFVYPMFQRDSLNVLKGLKEAFKVTGKPVEIFSDDDGAFKAEVEKYLDDLSIAHKTTLTHANNVERFIRTMKKGTGDRIHFTKGRWTDMLKPTLKKYNIAIHSSTGMKPSEAHDDDKQSKCKSKPYTEANPIIKPINITDYDFKQSKYEHVPKLPFRSIVVASSTGGETVLIQDLILNVYRDCFARIFICSPSVHNDPTFVEVKKYQKDNMKVDDEKKSYIMTPTNLKNWKK